MMCLCVLLYDGRQVRLGVRLGGPLAKSLPTPTHNKPPQISGFVVEDQPALLMLPKFLSVREFACLPAPWDPTDYKHINSMSMIWMKGRIFY